MNNNPVDLFDPLGLNASLWLKTASDFAKSAAKACIKYCTKKKALTPIGTNPNAGLPSPLGGAATTAGNAAVEVGTGLLKTGPAMTSNAYIASKCNPCKACEGDCDEDGSCAAKCAACEKAKSDMAAANSKL